MTRPDIIFPAILGRAFVENDSQIRHMNKFGAQRTVVDGITFHSKREASRYSELKLAERAGIVRNIELQVPYEFRHNDVLICKYFADFRYEELSRNGRAQWSTVVEDSKGHVTKDYAIKRKLMRAFFAIEIRET